MVPTGAAGRALSVVEAGMGFVFLAVIISYLPVLYQAFSRREITISLLDARAGSPPSAGELLRRLAAGRSPAGAGPFLVEWERWAAELLESHISFPVLSYYRSQHENQSWVGALTAILDTSALLIAGVDGPDSYQARLTFAMARHAAVDLALVFQTPPLPPQPDRLPRGGLRPAAGVALRGGGDDARRAGGGDRAGGVARSVRAVRQRPGGALSVRAAALPAGKAAGGQLANQSPGCRVRPASAACRRPAPGTTTSIDGRREGDCRFRHSERSEEPRQPALSIL